MDRDNSGTLSVNDRKAKPNHPDHRGKATINGVEYWVSGWNKTGPNGPFVSLAFQRKQEPARERTAADSYDAQFGSGGTGGTDEVPF